MIICEGALSSVVPLENASMPGRVVAQWDKDDCEDLGIIKVDLLGLGMMAAMQDTLEICQSRGRPVDLAAIPKDDAATYDLLCRADTIGTFQVESRAQMATLPRMMPREFYDVVVEVAIIRPGPIQGGLLHPYLARRAGREPVDYIDERLRPVLERTLGVPLFQEQLLKIAMVMADFTGSEAEELRRALSYHRSHERMDKVCVKLRAGLARKAVPDATAERIVQSVQSFAVYGFPESHAISFALIAYASCWMKVHRAPEFFAGLLNNQPMGFYSPATLVKDAVRHGVRIRPVNVADSDWLCAIEENVQRPTSNVQRPTSNVQWPPLAAQCVPKTTELHPRHWMLDVGRWTLDVRRTLDVPPQASSASASATSAGCGARTASAFSRSASARRLPRSRISSSAPRSRNRRCARSQKSAR